MKSTATPKAQEKLKVKVQFEQTNYMSDNIEGRLYNTEQCGRISAFLGKKVFIIMVYSHWLFPRQGPD